MILSSYINTTDNYLDLYRVGYEIMSSRRSSSLALAATSEGYQVALSNLGQFKSSLASFQTTALGITGSGLNLFTASSSDAAVITASSDSSAIAGSYGIVVSALAQGQTLVSGSHLSSTAAIGGGATTTVSFDFGTTVGSVFTTNPDRATESVTITSSNNSLQGIALAINAADIGISASVIFNGTDYVLGLTSPTGSDNSLRITVTGDATLQGLLAFDPAGAMNLTQTGTAQDASLSINGIAISSSSNVVAGAITGTTLNLNAVGSSNLVIAADTDAIKTKVTDFVAAYNSLLSTLKSFGSSIKHNANFFRSIQSKLGTTLYSTPNGVSGIAYNSLAQLGISTRSGGTLSVDDTILNNAIALDHSAVTSLFSNNGAGIADTLVSQIDDLIGSSGTLAGRSEVLEKVSSSVDQRKSRIAYFQDLATRRLDHDYSRLGLALTSYHLISSLLTKQFSLHA